MASLIDLFYARIQPVIERRSEPIQRVPEAGAVQEALHQDMWEEYQTFVRQAAYPYERLPASARNAVLPKLLSFQERADLAYHQGDLAAFQAALVEAQALLSDNSQDAPERILDKHWTYKAWSRVLDAEVWFVCCEQEVAQLTATSVARGCIYTEAELVELLRLPQQPSVEALRSLHAVKSYFDATVVAEDDDDKPEAT